MAGFLNTRRGHGLRLAVTLIALAGCASHGGLSLDAQRAADLQQIATQAVAFHAAKQRPAESLADIATFGPVPTKDPAGRAYEYQLDHYDPDLDSIVSVCIVFDAASKTPLHIGVAGRDRSLDVAAGRNCFNFNIYPGGEEDPHHH